MILLAFYLLCAVAFQPCRAAQARKACQLLAFNEEEHQLVVVKQCLETLRDATKPIRILSANGKARGWKSSTENAVISAWSGASDLECLEPFEVGATVESCTHGIWMAVQKMDDGETIIFLDVEGSSLGDDIMVAQLSLLTSILSSSFMFFVPEYFDNYALKYLSTLVNYHEADAGLKSIDFGKLFIVITDSFELAEGQKSWNEYVMYQLRDQNEELDRDRQMIRDYLMKHDFEAVTIEYEPKLKRAKSSDKQHGKSVNISPGSEYYSSITKLTNLLKKNGVGSGIETGNDVIETINMVVEIYNNPKHAQVIASEHARNFDGAMTFLSQDPAKAIDQLPMLMDKLLAVQEQGHKLEMENMGIQAENDLLEAELNAAAEKRQLEQDHHETETKLMQKHLEDAKRAAADRVRAAEAREAEANRREAEARRNPGGGGGGGGGSCFPEGAIVVTETGTKKMRYVQIGDKVLTLSQSGSPEFSDVIAFGYYDPDVLNEMLRIDYSGSPDSRANNSLTLTSRHFLPLKKPDQKDFIMTEAGAVNPGDIIMVCKQHENLEHRNFRDCITEVDVLKTTIVTEKGKYGPFTMTGDIFVDGVLCSNYDDPTGFGLGHGFYHALVKPLRVAYESNFFPSALKSFGADICLLLGHAITAMGNSMQGLMYFISTSD